MTFWIFLSIFITVLLFTTVAIKKVFTLSCKRTYYIGGAMFGCFALFLTTFFLRGKLPFWLDYGLMEFSFNWLISIPFLFIISLIILILTWTKILPPHKRIRAFYVGFFIAIITLIYGRFQYRDIKVEEYNFPIDAKVVVASDIHLGNYITKGNLARFVDKINSQNPDIVLFVGDVIDGELEPVVRQNMEEEFLKLNAPLGKYMVFGNHEAYGKQTLEIVSNFMRKSGITPLRDSVILINDSFYLLGRKDKRERRLNENQILEQFFPNHDKELPIIIMDHQPMTFDEYERQKKGDESNGSLKGNDFNALLYLHGHTHKGQIYPISKIVENMYPHSYGLYEEEGVNYIITSGLGLWGPKYRFGTQSEIWIIGNRISDSNQ